MPLAETTEDLRSAETRSDEVANTENTLQPGRERSRHGSWRANEVLPLVRPAAGARRRATEIECGSTIESIFVFTPGAFWGIKLMDSRRMGFVVS